MKNYIAGLILVVSLSSFAQDYEEINQRNAQLINTEHQSKIKKRLSEIKRFFIADFSKTKLFKRNKLSEGDKNKKDLLRCVTKVINKNTGGYDGPRVLQQILIAAMDGGTLSAEKDVLQEPTAKCWEVYDNLYRFPDRVISRLKLEEAIKHLNEDSIEEK